MGDEFLRYRNGTATEFENRTIENGLAEANPLIFLVGRARFELATNGLKVRCSTS